ncbi:MAG TPA: hypothetical protein VNM48_18355, partial [Chloroflexota bacterium]|nr:hypothetical protein [Chloroflexota bacterium]
WRRGSLAGGTEPDVEREEIDREKLLRQAYVAYRSNPLAYAIVEMQTSFVLGGGASVVAEDARVQRVVDRFWKDKENRMGQRLYSLLTELSLFGEQFLRFFIDPMTGRVVIRQLDPLYIKEIETDPEDWERPLRYLWKPPRTDWASDGLDGNWEGEWIPAEEVLHVKVNGVTGALRGRIDLAPVLGYVRRYREWLDDRVHLNRVKSAFMWDVTVAGADSGDIQRKRARWATGPEMGTVLFHNEGEKWSAVQPRIEAGGASADGRAIRLMVATGALLPEHYLSEGGNANRATASEMGLPAMKRFQRRQEVFRTMLEEIVERVIESAVRAGMVGPRAKKGFVVRFEELSPAPVGAMASAVGTLTSALAVAEERGWVRGEEARKLGWRDQGQGDESAPQGGEGESGM